MIERLDNTIGFTMWRELWFKREIKANTLETHIDIGTFGVIFACLPSSICTEMLACDKSTPEVCNACVSVSNNLSKYTTLKS